MNTNAEQALMVTQLATQLEEGGPSPTVRLLKSDWYVNICSLKLTQELVSKYHYSGGGSNTRVLCCGLWRKGQSLDQDCYGCSWWIPPTKSAGTFIHPCNPQGVLALSRLVVKPDTPKNACSFLIRHSMRFIDRSRWPVLVTYADEWQGHTGGIYIALRDCGWKQEGVTKPERTYVNALGRMGNRKRGPKTLTHAEMMAEGYTCIGSFKKKRFVHRIL